jgi:signal transduction histidine kinase
LSQTPLDFLNLFVRAPGDVIYFLAVIAISQAGLFMALSERLRRPQYRDSGRYTLAFLGIVLAWGVVMLGALYTLVSSQDISDILPPLERAAHVMIILLAGWAFLTADHEQWGRLPNLILLLLMALVIGGYIVTGVQWLNTPNRINFNLTSLGVAWTFISTAFCILGFLLTLVTFRLTTDAPLKLVFFVILLTGHVVTLFQIGQLNILGNDAGAARLALLAAIPIVPAVVYRMVISHLQSELYSQAAAPPMPLPTEAAPFLTKPPAVAETPAPAPAVVLPPSASAPTVSPIQRDSIQLLKTLGLILEEATPGNIPERIVTSGMEVLKADIGAVLTFQDANYADISAAFDTATKQPISGIALNLDNQPTLVNAIERRLQRPLYPDRNGDELRDMYNRLDITQIGPAYFQPLMSGKDLTGILMVGNPYSKRELEEGERELLKGIGIIAGNLLSLSYAARDARQKAEERAIQAMVQGVPIDDVGDSSLVEARQELQSSLQASREQINELTKQVTQLKIELDYEHGRVASEVGDTEEGLSVSQRILTLTEEQQKLRDEREQLAARLQEAETALAGATATNNSAMMNTMIEVLRREKDDLTLERENLQRQLEEMRANQPPAAIAQAAHDIAERMGQEKAKLETERDQLRGKLGDINAQLKALGIEDGAAGLGQLLVQLTEQRTALQTKIENLTLERTALLNERAQFKAAIQQEKEREARLQNLEHEIKHLAADREALNKQRDQMRAERDEAVGKQDAIKQHRARLLAESSGYQIELAEAHQEQAKLRALIQQLANEKSDSINRESRLLAEKQALETERDMLMARTEGNRERLQQLGEDGVGSLTRMIEAAAEERNQLERELNETQNLLADAQNQIDMLKVRANAVPQQTDGETLQQSYEPEVLLGMIQELRTPLTSIVGYIDLLLDEAAGILGEMQHKFLQRVASNVTRLTFMLDDLTRASAMDQERFRLMPEPIDVIGVVEDAISNSTYQFREKGLTVHLNLDNNVPKIQVDRDAISEILQQLLMNAYLASPPDSPVVVTAHRQPVQLSQNANLADATDCLLMSIEDRGGGIPQDDISRVFARKYKADHPLVQGLGDTGVGLSIAKTLAERHGGGLWLETVEGVGSIFYFALPIETRMTAESKDN